MLTACSGPIRLRVLASTRAVLATSGYAFLHQQSPFISIDTIVLTFCDNHQSSHCVGPPIVRARDCKGPLYV